MRILFFVILLLVGCESSSKEPVSLLYFDIANRLDYGDDLSSIKHSFALTDARVEYAVIDLIVRTNKKSDEKRYYSIGLGVDSDAIPQEDFGIVNKYLSIAPRKLTDTIKVVLLRNDKLKIEQVLLSICLEEDELFEINDKSTAKIFFDDIEVIPTWWSDWHDYFGDYCKEKFVMWKEIYYEGVDKNGYYWDNMPPFAVEESYPDTFRFIAELKNYFDTYEIYPDGDDSKDRILLP